MPQTRWSYYQNIRHSHPDLYWNSKTQTQMLKEQLSILGYAHNQGRGGALRYLETGETQKDGFGTDAQKYIDEVKKALGFL